MYGSKANGNLWVQQQICQNAMEFPVPSKLYYSKWMKLPYTASPFIPTNLALSILTGSSAPEIWAHPLFSHDPVMPEIEPRIFSMQSKSCTADIPQGAICVFQLFLECWHNSQYISPKVVQRQMISLFSRACCSRGWYICQLTFLVVPILICHEVKEIL